MSENSIIRVFTGPRGLQGAAGATGPTGDAVIGVHDSVTDVGDVSELIFGAGFTVTPGGSGEVTVDFTGSGSGGDASSSGVWGSEHSLAFNGTTDQTRDINTLLAAQNPGTVRFFSSTGAALRINGRINVPSHQTLDLSQIDLDYGRYGEVSGMGGYAELPASSPFQLRVNAVAGDTVLQVNITPQGTDMSLLAVGAFIILRGMKDAGGGAIQRHEARITARSATLGAETITISPPIPTDTGSFLATYAAGDYEINFGTADHATITVKTNTALTANVAVGDDNVTVGSSTGFARGDIVELFDINRSSTVGGDNNDSLNSEILRVRSVDSTHVYFEQGIERAFTTARFAALFKLNIVTDVKIIGARSVSMLQAPTVDPFSRRNYYTLNYAERSVITGAKVDEATATNMARGSAGRLLKCIDSRIENSRRICNASAASLGLPGDQYGFTDLYSTNSTLAELYTERCRYGRVVYGSTRTALLGGRSVNDLVGGTWLAGLNEIGVTIDGVRVEMGRDFAADSTVKSGIVFGSVGNQGGAHRVTIRDVEIGAPPSLALTRGITINAGSSGIELTKDVRVNGAAIAVYLTANPRNVTLTIDDVDLGGLLAEDCGAGFQALGAPPAWVTSTVYTASATLPQYVENAGHLYRATVGGTAGATPPTHTSSTASDGGVTWTFITSTLPVGLTKFRADNTRLRRCLIQGYVWRATGCQVEDLRATEPAATVSNPGFYGREITSLVVRNSDIHATAGGVSLLTCPGAMVIECLFTDMNAGGAWFTDLGGNTTTSLINNNTRGTTSGIDTGGGSTLSVIGAGGSGVATFIGRAGAVVAVSGDYTAAQITETGAAKIMTSAERSKLAAVSTALLVPDASTHAANDVLTIVNPATPSLTWAAPPGAGGTGEVNTAANTGSTGAGVYDSKVGVQLRFRRLASTTPALAVTENVPSTLVELAIANASTSQAGLMSAADKAALAALGSAGVTSFNTRTGAVVSASGDYTASQITDVPASKVIMTAAERAQLVTYPTTFPSGGTVGQVLGKNASNALAWLAAPVSFPVVTPNNTQTFVLGPSTYATTLAAGDATNPLIATSIIYSPGTTNEAYALQLVSSATGGDFLRCLSTALHTVVFVGQDTSDNPRIDLFSNDAIASRRLTFRANQAGLMVANSTGKLNDTVADNLAASEALLVKGDLRVTGAITVTSTAAGTTFANPLLIGTAGVGTGVYLWVRSVSGTAKLFGIDAGTTPTASNGTALW